MIDVVLSFITKNSYTKMKHTIGLEKVLDSTLQIPYKSIILVDDSKDETAKVFRKWCDQHGKEILVVRSALYGAKSPTRATARQTAIDLFLTNFGQKWLMFVDDDVILNEGWWEDRRRGLGNKLGCFSRKGTVLEILRNRLEELSYQEIRGAWRHPRHAL